MIIQLREQGFDGYAMNLVTYPKGMECFLMDEIRLHRFVSSFEQVGLRH